MGATDNCGFGYGFVPNKSAFDLSSPKSVAGDVQDVVHAARDPEVPVRVAPRAVTAEVVPRAARYVGRLVELEEKQLVQFVQELARLHIMFS